LDRGGAAPRHQGRHRRFAIRVPATAEPSDEFLQDVRIGAPGRLFRHSGSPGNQKQKSASPAHCRHSLSDLSTSRPVRCQTIWYVTTSRNVTQKKKNEKVAPNRSSRKRQTAPSLEAATRPFCSSALSLPNLRVGRLSRAVPDGFGEPSYSKTKG